MGNETACCCSKRGPETADASWNFQAMRKSMAGKTLGTFMKSYLVDKLASNCHGGIVENYICQPVSGNALGEKKRPQLVQSIEMGSEKLAMAVATHKLALAMDLDPSVKTVDCMKEFYESGNRMFVVHDFIGQGYKDLYMLANIKGSFSEHDIGQIAVQLLKGVSYLHH